MARRMTSLMTAALFLAALAGAASCTGPASSQPSFSKTVKTRTHKTITLSETHPVGQSLSTIKISTNGFEHDFSEKYEDMDPVADVLMGDLDCNGRSSLLQRVGTIDLSTGALKIGPMTRVRADD